MARLHKAIIVVTVLLMNLDATVRAGGPASPPSYFIYPVKSELQKELAPSQASAFVLVDATNLVKDGQTTLKALRLPILGKELLPYKNDNAKLHFTLFFPRSDTGQPEQRALMRYALIGFGHDLGFPKVTAHGYYPNSDLTWDKLAATFTGQGRQPEGDEPAATNDVVKVYPVRTNLSRFLTSDADCVVIITPSLKKHAGVIPQEVLEATTELLSKVKLSQRHRISFRLRHDDPADRVDQQHIELLLQNLQRFAQTLGFATSSVTFR